MPVGLTDLGGMRWAFSTRYFTILALVTGAVGTINQFPDWQGGRWPARHIWITPFHMHNVGMGLRARSRLSCSYSKERGN